MELTKLEYSLQRQESLFRAYLQIKEHALTILYWQPPHDITVEDQPPYYTDHGINHSKRLLRILDNLTEKIELNVVEIFSLLASV